MLVPLSLFLLVSTIYHVEGVSLENENEHFTAALRQLQNEVSNINGKLEKYEHKITKQQSRIKQLEEEVAYLRDRDVSSIGNDFLKQRTVRAHDVNVAFTTYLDHPIKNLAQDDTVVFNQVLLNDAGAYDSSSGVFTAPVSGVYMFSWSVTARRLAGEHAYDIWVKLVVNGVHKLGAVAESQSTSDDNQGSSTAVLRLAEADRVWLAHYSSFPDIYGNDNERTTSFSVALLYQDL